MKLLLNPSSLALWYDIIHDAESACSIHLKEETEAYLVFLMMRYTTRPDIGKHIIASDLLASLHLANPSHRESKLQEVGDNCLIFSGLFPGLAQKRLVKISYFVKMGQCAYSALSKANSDLYSTLAKQFVSLMDIIQSLRRYESSFPLLLPLQAYELWNETGSQRALSDLKKYSTATPLAINSEDSELPVIK